MGVCEAPLCWKGHLASELSEPQSRSDSLFLGRWVPHGIGHFPELVPEQAWGQWTCRLLTLAVGSMLVGLRAPGPLNRQTEGQAPGDGGTHNDPPCVSTLMEASGQRCIPQPTYD